MLSIRPYKPGDEEGFQKLDRLVEVHSWNRRNLDNWNWRFKGANPAGPPLMIYAENDGEIIGHFAAIPMNYRFNGENIIGSHSAAMVIHPDWQNKGLIKFVADKLIKDLVKQKIPFTYGYPNDNAYDLHINILNYEDVASQRLFIKKIDKKTKKELNNNTLVWKKIERFDKDFDNFWDIAKDDYKAIVIRDSDFLNWRYLDRPDANYQAYGVYSDNVLKGYCVLKIYQDEKVLRGHFIDLFTQLGDYETGYCLIKNGINFFENQKNAHANS